MKSAAYTLYYRSAWHPRPAGPTALQHFTVEGFLHHSEDQNGQVFDTLAKQGQKMRDIQAFHMNNTDGKHGWSDIGYHYVIFQPNHRHRRAHIFGARAVTATPAAQMSHNSNTLAVCVVGNGDVETLHEHTRTALRFVFHRHSVKKIGGHRDVTPTDCPGARFYAEIPHQARILGVDHF